MDKQEVPGGTLAEERAIQLSEEVNDYRSYDISCKYKHVPWCYTVKKLGKTEKSDYDKILAVYSKLGLIKYNVYEQDSCNKWHIHGIIYLRKGMLRRRLCLTGFNVKLVECYSEEQWMTYCRKDQKVCLLE